MIAPTVLAKFAKSSLVPEDLKRRLRRELDDLAELYRLQQDAPSAARAAEAEAAEKRIEALVESANAVALPSKAEIVAELARRELARRAAREDLLSLATALDPSYEISWHHKALASRLSDWLSGKTPRLIVCMPPRHGKSELVSRLLPAFIFGRDPSAKVLLATHTASLALDLSRDVQAKMESPRYREIFGDRLYAPKTSATPSSSQTLRTAQEFRVLNDSGSFYATGVDGAIVGRGFQFGIVDDPIKGWKEARSAASRERLLEWWRREFMTRRSHDARILITVTRWHEADLIGSLLDEDRAGVGEGWSVFSLPALRESGPPTVPEDARAEGEALWPSRYPEEFFKGIKAQLATFSALYQQRPAPETGELFKAHWMTRRWRVMPAAFDEVIISVDCNVKETVSGSFASLTVWGRVGEAEFYLLDERRDRYDFVTLKETFRDLCGLWPEAAAKLIEDAANGPALISAFRRGDKARGEKAIPGLIGVKAKGSKVARAEMTTPYFEAGNVILPEAGAQGRSGPITWIGSFVAELLAFPTGNANDRVDSLSQAISHFTSKRGFKVRIG